MTDAKIIRACACVEEAVVVWSLLRDGGFQATMDNWHYACLDWAAVQALGGIHIRVPDYELIPAAEYLIESISTADERLADAVGAEPYAPLPQKRWKAWSMLFLYLGGGIFFIWPMIWLLSRLPSHWFPQGYHGQDVLYVRQGFAISAHPISVDGFTILIMLGFMLYVTLDEMYKVKDEGIIHTDPDTETGS